MKVRGIGMAAATAANWLANGVISITFPLLTNSIGLAPTSACGVLFAHCFLIFIPVFGYMVLALLTLAFVYFLVPETKGKTLEEVTEVRQGSERGLHLSPSRRRCCAPIRSPSPSLAHGWLAKAVLSSWGRGIDVCARCIIQCELGGFPIQPSTCGD